MTITASSSSISRDRYGITQVVFRPEESAAAAELAHQLRREDVMQVRGKVAARLPGTENAKLASGAVELVAEELTIINKSDVPPFPLDAEGSNEDLRLTLPLSRYAPRPARAQPARAPPHRQDRARLPRRRRLPRNRDAHPVQQHARRRAQFPRAEPAACRARSTRCRRRRSSTSNSSWSRAWTSISRSPTASATKTCAPTASRSSPRSTSRRRSSCPKTFTR